MRNFKTISDKRELEQLGKNVSVDDLSEITNILHEDTSHHWKLTPLFIQLRPQIFAQFLQNISFEKLEVFRKESSTESMQHQLLLLSHLIENKEKELFETAQRLNTEINELKSHIITGDVVREFKKKINTLNLEYEISIQVVSKALMIAWNSNRIDLIERFSKLKDRLQTALVAHIGFSSKTNTGLFSTLEKVLHAVFGDPADLQDLEALNDDDPAIAVFPKFSIWFREDYKEVGLIPDLPGEYIPEELLPQEAEVRLKELGIHTIKDMKEKQIFSRQLLKDFLSRPLQNPL